MKLQNIARLLLYREQNDYVSTLEELRTLYGIDPDGTIYYYGIGQGNLAGFQKTKKAFNSADDVFFGNLVKQVNANADDEKTFVLGLEPEEDTNTYEFVRDNIPLVEQLAVELNAVQQEVRAAGKRLNMIVRYASEMNDPHQNQGHDVAGYRSTFVQVRLAFQKWAPSILFSFSPALRADLPESDITQYWPGDDYVDVIGGTWYIGAIEERPGAVSNMQKYFLHRASVNKPFAVSELGGCNSAGGGNDAVLQDMLHELEALQWHNVSFNYVTLFLGSKYGSDATLGFLKT